MVKNSALWQSRKSSRTVDLPNDACGKEWVLVEKEDKDNKGNKIVEAHLCTQGNLDAGKLMIPVNAQAIDFLIQFFKISKMLGLFKTTYQGGAVGTSCEQMALPLPMPSAKSFTLNMMMHQCWQHFP